MEREEFDVIVVGAGPGGLIAATEIAKSDAQVLCLDKKQEIGVPKRCAEGLGLGALEKVGLKPEKEWAVNEIFGAVLYAPSGKKLEIRFHEVAGHILERRVFEKFLAKRASKAGAKIKVKSNVVNLERRNGKVVLTANEFDEEKNYSASLILAADGVESTVARKLGLNTTNKLQDIDSGFQYEMTDVSIPNPEMIHLFFGTEIAPRGYVWIFPKGKSHANIGIGIGALAPEKAKVYLDKWIASQEGLKNGSVIEVNAGAIPVGGFLEQMTLDNLIVLGDAAHQVNPIHGGGIALSMEAAMIASKVAVDAIKKNDFSNKFLSSYSKQWWKQRGQKMKKILKMRQMLESMNDSDFETLVDSITGEDVLRIAEADFFEVTKIVSTKLVKHPKLAKIMLKYLK